ncbi:MAG: acyl-CoA dehydrogenase family protein [Acidobacteriia bacterium]|nr:acyl-CoA dehydrogenase family protein [Terriglobia bacterium]
MSTPFGGSFLLDAPPDVFTPEDFTAEHRAIAKATDDFWTREVEPNLEAIQNQDFAVLKRTLRRSAELGLIGVLLPERYGGMELDLVSSMIVAEGIGPDGSYAACHGGQAGIGALPVFYFGTEEQKQRYLPRLASAELIAAYALTEPQAGSDALAARTRADLSPDGTHYVLNGQKMWITNGGIADLYTVFAKVGGEKFTAFLVERAWAGVSPGAEEKKMGLKGSSTTAVFFDHVKVPVENVLGEIGRGHIIAFNILNIGRLSLAVSAHGKCRSVLAGAIRYAQERRAFGKSISEFGLIQHKLAEMAIRMYVNESMAYRLIGHIQDSGQPLMKAGEEFAAECSFLKIFGSETLDYVVDEALQIHGGYGYHQDYPVERAYRDARINRIFEGTNEINRLLATGMLLRRAKKGALPLAGALKNLSTTATGDVVKNAKKVGLFLLAVASKQFGDSIEDQQEVVAGITDVLMNAFALESATARARKTGKDNAADMTAVFADETMENIKASAKTVLAACSEGDALRTNLALLRGLTAYELVNSIALRRKIAGRLLQAGKYVV